MKAFRWAIVAIVVLIGGYIAYQQVSPTSSPDVQLGVYSGSLPCTGSCKEIKTTLTLYENAKTSAPTLYRLEQEYVGKDVKSVVKKGKWAIQKGFPQHADATVYALNSDQSKTHQLYAWAVSDNQLTLLNQSKGRITSPLTYSLTKQ